MLRPGSVDLHTIRGHGLSLRDWGPGLESGSTPTKRPHNVALDALPELYSMTMEAIVDACIDKRGQGVPVYWNRFEIPKFATFALCHLHRTYIYLPPTANHQCLSSVIPVIVFSRIDVACSFVIRPGLCNTTRSPFTYDHVGSLGRPVPGRTGFATGLDLTQNCTSASIHLHC